MTTAADYAQNIAQLVDRAERPGGSDAARYLIQEFVNHASEYQDSNIPDSDKRVIAFIVRAMREILNGKPGCERAALCLDTKGRPPVPIARNLWLAFEVYEQHKSLGVVGWAIDKVARDTKTPKPTVKAAWKLFGGLNGISALLAGKRIQKRKVKKAS